MVFEFDLDDPGAFEVSKDPRFTHPALVHVDPANSRDSHQEDDDRPNPNLNGFSASLSCYPVVTELASLLDLNSLHNLSRTCRQFRANLLQFRDQLVTRTLRCSNENLSYETALSSGFRDGRAVVWDLHTSIANSSRRMTSGRVGTCARDMVAECRRCGVVVCRNCTAKPPSTRAFNGRHRRLCHTCRKVPIDVHLTSKLQTSPRSSSRSSPRSSPSRLIRLPTPPKEDDEHDPVLEPKPSFTYWAYKRNPCVCASPNVWLCPPCGNGLLTDDTLYARGWRWRSHYALAYPGASEGCKSVECGRKNFCLAARLVEQEVECDASELQALEEEAEKVAADGTGRSWTGSSFNAQEMDGGGLIKMKVRRLVSVGAEVDEFEECEDGNRCLAGELEGEVRSWCAWCERVIPSIRDKKDLSFSQNF